MRCRLCPTSCRLAPGATGACRTRRNEDGRLMFLYYGACSALAVDPIEKKPLYHFYPGSSILSLGSIGCNLACSFCQNWEIAQSTVETEDVTPEAVVRAAVDLRSEGCVGVAYTYNEPLVGYEFVFDTAKLAKDQGLANVLVTNGEIAEEPLRELLPLIDALNIDIKGFTEDFYHEMCRGRLAPVLRAAEIAHESAHVEITNLVIPTKNDNPGETAALVDWIHAHLGADTPLHFSRYYPRHHAHISPTPLDTLLETAKIARAKLNYVYIGNVPDADAADTFCPQCGATLIKRHGYDVDVRLTRPSCPACGEAIAIRL